MPRQKQDKEVRLREKVKMFIDNHPMQTTRIIYYSPTYMRGELKKKGVKVTLAYVIRRYAELCIVNENGMYVK